MTKDSGCATVNTMFTKVFLVIFSLILLTDQSAFAYWIWTPKSGKWVNPKTAVKPTPREQAEAAIFLFEGKHYDEAGKEFRKLIKAYPKSAEAAVSQYYLGRINEAAGKPYEAFKAYQLLIDKYPFSDKIQEAIERQYGIGEEFVSGKRKGVSAVFAPENPGVEIFSKVVENSNYGPLADKAQYKLGLVLKGLSRYYEAEEAFFKLIKTYPDSEWVPAAQFQIAACRAAVSQGPDYDQGATKEAKERFMSFVNAHPDAVLSPEAQKNIDALKDKEACSAFNSGRFYEKQRIYQSARIYYEDVVKNYPGTMWAAKSLERLQILERKKK